MLIWITLLFYSSWDAAIRAYTFYPLQALMQVVLIAASGTHTGPDLVSGGGGGCGCMLLRHPAPTCPVDGPDLCT